MKAKPETLGKSVTCPGCDKAFAAEGTKPSWPEIEAKNLLSGDFVLPTSCESQLFEKRPANSPTAFDRICKVVLIALVCPIAIASVIYLKDRATNNADLDAMRKLCEERRALAVSGRSDDIVHIEEEMKLLALKNPNCLQMFEFISINSKK